MGVVIKISMVTIIGIIVFLTVYLLFYMLKRGSFDKLIYGIYQRQWRHYIKRRENHELIEEHSGLIEEKGILAKLDRMIDEAGWRKKYSYISSEIYVLAGICITLLITMVTYFISKRTIACMIVALSVLIFWGGLLYVCASVRYCKIQQQLMIFINLLENYSRTSDDLVDIIVKTENYLDEPLKWVIGQFQWEARHTGEIETALSHLKKQLPHRKLQEIIQNLDMCRRHDANYDEVICDMRISVQEYLKFKEERNAIRQTAKGNILLMMFVGVFIINLTNGFVDGGIYRLLSSNLIGILILIYIFFLALIGMWQFVKVDRG